jgi:hypothetical protein
LRTDVEVGVDPHGDVVASSSRPAAWRKGEVLAQVELEGTLQGGLDRGDADLAIALGAMAVTAREQRALDEDRQIERRAGAELLVVEIAAEGARDQRGHPAPMRRWRRAHHAEERRKRQFHAPGQVGDVPLGGRDGYRRKA